MKLKNVCPICNKEFYILQPTHKCVKKFENFDSFRSFFIKNNYSITEKYLKEVYIEKQRGISFIQKETGLDIKSIIFMLKRYDIKIRTCKESANSKSVRNAYKKTCLLKYGAENVLSKNTEPYKKRNNTVKEKYGVENIWQVLNLFSNGKKMNNRKISSLNRKIFDFLDSENIIYETEFPLKFKIYDKIKTRFYDIKINNLIIEINGDYFHANPKFYKEDDIINYKGKRKVKNIWLYDQFKLGLCIQKGYDILVIWEDDIKKDFENVKKIIKQKIWVEQQDI